MSAGFTVIELLVVCAIIVVITGLVLIDNNKFGGEVLLENLAYDVALSIRQAQVYGIAVKGFGTNDFTEGYGMYFTTSNDTGYILFADTENKGIYDPSASPSETVATTELQSGYTISGLCVIPDFGTGGTCNPAAEIDIMYIRPEPEAYITASTIGRPSQSCLQNQSNCNYEAQITLTSPKGDMRTVVVDSTGQISVQLQ